MALFKFDNFSGELPSVSPRSLGAAAQLNQNLYLPTLEFRPLKADLAVAACPSGTKTLHRLARKADGSFNSDASTGWITSTALRSYVKGQVNDERTERTYFTFDDGSARPRIVDASGADRVLGVPRPVQPVVTLTTVDELTSDEASQFLRGEYVQKVQEAVAASLIALTSTDSRYSGTTIYGGPYSSHGLLFPSSAPAGYESSHWVLWGQVPDARASQLGLDLVRLGALSTGGYTYVPLVALPYTYRLNSSSLTTQLQAITSPSGGQFMSNDLIASFIDKASTALGASTTSKSARDRLETITKQFSKILAEATTPGTVAKPTEPAKPSVPEWIYDWGDGTSSRAPEWTAYDEAMTTYKADLEEYNDAVAALTDTTETVNNSLANLQTEAGNLTREIESQQQAAWKANTESTAAVLSFIDSQGGLNAFNVETVDRVVESRFYVVTFVTDWGEESQPSPVSQLVEVDQNDTVAIARPGSSSGEAYAARNIAKWRLYRSSTGNDTTAFQFVAELPIASATVADNTKQSELGETLPTTTWAEPPYRMDAEYDGYPKPVVGTNPFLRGLTGMPNGIMAGFFDNTVAFCEPYVPYAWPTAYQVVTEFPIVGMAVFGQTLVVGTTANPYFITGADSASMIAQKLDANQACVSARSMTAVRGGVVYASPDGLCLADPNGVRVISGSMFTREDWQALDPSSMVCIEHESVVYIFYTGGCLTLDTSTSKLGRVELSGTAAFVDRATDTLYVANDTSITAVFGGATRRTAKWKSGRGVLAAHAAMAWIKILGDQNPNAPVTVRWYGDGQLVQTLSVTNTQPMRLVAGRWIEHEIEIESSSRVTQVMLAGESSELRAA